MEGIMPGDDDFKRLETEFLALARRIFDAGGKAERARMMALLAQGEERPTGVRREPHTRATGYGAVSMPVRDALTALAAESTEGVGAREIADYFVRRGSGPNERQVRAALKTLTNTGEAIRASRGRYLPRLAATSPTPGESPDALASGNFSLAAE
jgi:hypothetical protein